jgi:hypothetical protein
MFGDLTGRLPSGKKNQQVYFTGGLVESVRPIVCRRNTETSRFRDAVEPLAVALGRGVRED